MINNIKIFNEMKFGLFLHWGLYAIPGGRWKGETMDYIGEWLQSRFRIPNHEYAQLAEQFNPIHFNADEWIKMTKEAGMDYIVFTAKHHDGFAMYHSKVSAFNVVDATPFKRDPLKELAAACQKYDVKLGIYYSQNLDWKEHDGGDPGDALGKNRDDMSWGNDWDFPDWNKKDFSQYFNNKVIPQVTELLTQYGDVWEFWCDCQLNMEPKYSQQLRALIKKLQPKCLINSRIGNDCGDFKSMGDNQIIKNNMTQLTECPITLNKTWGFKHDDHGWKSAEQVAETLALVTSRNANLLLNIGPRPDGRFPDASITILQDLASWRDEYNAGIKNSQPNPFLQNFSWGECTLKDNTLNFFVKKWSEILEIAGIHNKIVSASVPFEQNGLTLKLFLPPKKTNPILPRITVDFEGELNIEQTFVPMNNTLLLEASTGTITHGSNEDNTTQSHRVDVDGECFASTNHSILVWDGSLANWHNSDDFIEWELQFDQDKEYQIELTTIQKYHSNPWMGQRIVEITWQNQTITQELNQYKDLSNQEYQQGDSALGSIKVYAGEKGKLRLRTIKLLNEEAVSMNFVNITLFSAK